MVVLSPDPALSRRRAQGLAERGYDAAWLELAFDDSLLPRLDGRKLEPGPPAGALWGPDPYLFAHRSLLPSPELGPVADLGAGNGRNAVFLAQEGYRVEAYERLLDALELAEDRARRQMVSIHTHQFKLMSVDDLPAGRFGTLLFLRFHKPSLIEGASRRLAPGGVLVVNTYRAKARPERAHRLRLENLPDLLPPDQWEFLDGPRAREEEDESMVSLVARLRTGRRGALGETA